MEEKTPLVSIIVRTKDRPELLKKALQSIASQTYRPIEVVLVNDGGCDLPEDELKEILGDVSLNYIRLKENRGRAGAGNVGIENTMGEFIGFLDDDDEFYPGHLETLVSSLEQGDYKIAYSAVKLNKNASEGNNVCFTPGDKDVFAREFSYEDLIIANYIPLISLLFEYNLLKSLMFDETFDLYEDWDMLIRAGEENKFHFVNKITAGYNQWSNIQIAFKSSPEVIKQATLKIYLKHLDRFTPLLIYRLCSEEWANRPEVKELYGIIQRKDNDLKNCEKKIQRLEAQEGDKEVVIQTIVNTKGWRYLEKYRQLRDKIITTIFLKKKG